MDVKIPEDWGKDPLSDFLQLANNNNIGVFDNFKKWFLLLKDIFLAFDKFAKNALNLPKFIEPFLFLRAFSSYLAAVRLATSGQLPEAFTILRNTLEYALYALYLSEDESHERSKIWLARNVSEEDKKKVRKEFKVNSMFAVIEKQDSNLSKIVKYLYDYTIDVGAHPNPIAVIRGIEEEHNEDRISYFMSYLETDPDLIILTLQKVAQVGIAVLQVFKLIFKERFDLLGISEDIDRLAKTEIDGINL